MAQHAKQWGTTPPISTAMPKPEDQKQNSEMVEELKRENNYEAQAETNKRMVTLQLLQKTLLEFIREVSRKMRLPQSQIEQFGGQIYPYGSYRLGVFGPGALLCMSRRISS
jgi:poly(A) polymerase